MTMEIQSRTRSLAQLDEMQIVARKDSKAHGQRYGEERTGSREGY